MQKITMVTIIVGQDVATLGSVRRLFFGIYSVPQSITEFLLLNVLPGLAGDLFSFICEKQTKYSRIIKPKLWL